MSEPEIVEYNGVEYVKIPDETNLCGECVFYDNKDGTCSSPDNPVFWGCHEKFIWRKKDHE